MRHDVWAAAPRIREELLVRGGHGIPPPNLLCIGEATEELAASQPTVMADVADQGAAGIHVNDTEASAFSEAFPR
ncbi:hypothetical protein QMZ05_02185 [Bradyrhizobium sp. INPA03-11B]|uniref:hypothetical protein n=1 Tax=Bradyrhizobium sp. INPA03-11B TaxID=418598 RepID=UPI00338EC3B4